MISLCILGVQCNQGWFAPTPHTKGGCMAIQNISGTDVMYPQIQNNSAVQQNENAQQQQQNQSQAQSAFDENRGNSIDTYA